MTASLPTSIKLISWNLLHKDGAGLAEIARLIEREQPDLLMMQEVKASASGLVALVGGSLDWEPLPDRVHGLAAWTPGLRGPVPVIMALPSGAMVQRVSQIVKLGSIAIANVHLSHGQVLNRRQIRAIAQRLPPRSGIVGDFNMVGPAMLKGFHDVGPRLATHRMSRVVPLRLDRCLVRGLICTEATVLPRGGSDHHPIVLRLKAVSDLSEIGE